MILEQDNFNTALQAVFTRPSSIDATAIFTLALVIVGLHQLGLFYWQLRFIRERLTDVIEVALAGTTAAKAASRQALVVEDTVCRK